MVYQGSKNRLSKFLVPIIQKYIDDNNIENYIELMIGGANLIDKIQCKNKIGSDINEDLIALLKYAQQDNKLSIAPEECTFQHYSEVRADKNHEKFSQEYRALIGYMASYGGRYYEGGYGRDSTGKRNIYVERLNNFRKQILNLQDIKLYCCDYRDFDTSKYSNALYYFDIPYKGTKQYGKHKFDYEAFYDYCRELSKNNIVLISEYNMPDDFECIWEKERKVHQKSNRENCEVAVEKLFKLKTN